MPQSAGGNDRFVNNGDDVENEFERGVLVKVLRDQVKSLTEMLSTKDTEFAEKLLVCVVYVCGSEFFFLPFDKNASFYVFEVSLEKSGSGWV